MSEKLTNKISCAACESAIIAGNIADEPAIQEHLQSCPACREFALFQQTLLAVPPVVKNDLPEFEVIMQKVHAEKARSRRNLRLITWPLSLAAAAALAVGGIVFQLPTAEKNISAPVENYFWDDSEILAAAWDESTVQLAWDQTSAYENRSISSMEAARQGSEKWSIEVFNPYNEDY